MLQKRFNNDGRWLTTLSLLNVIFLSRRYPGFVRRLCGVQALETLLMINLTQIKLTLATAIQINYLSNVNNSELVYIFQTYKYATQTCSQSFPRMIS